MKKDRIRIPGFLLVVLMSGLGTSAQVSAPFISENVSFAGEDTLHYGGTLTLPIGQEKPAAVIILSGTNPQNRDGEMAGHKVFKEIAEYLSTRGIAVLRTDDRGVGDTNGDYDKATTFDFATDAVAAVEYLKTRKDIRHDKIGLLGHSEGGAVACIAASRCKDVAFLISAAGLMTDGLSSVIRQNIDIVHAAPIPDYDKSRYDEINGIMFPIVYQYAEADSLVLANRMQEAYDKWKPRSDSIFKSRNAGEYDHFRFPIYRYILQATTPWYRFFIRYNPADYLSKVNIPVLAVNGTKDIMVNCEQNLENVKRYLAHNKDVTTVAIEGVNHLLLPCETGTQDEYAGIKSSVSPELLDVIYQWIKKHSR